MSQLDMFSESPKRGETIKINHGEYIYIPDFYDKVTADSYLKRLITDINWKQESMNMYGKKVPFPRLTAWYGDQDKPYSFSGITLDPNPWSPGLVKIKSDIEPKAKVKFNSVLLNRYRNGSDSISWHTDAEKELGKNPVIASVNFGAERKFQLKHIETNERIDILLKHGSLLIMQGELQHYWKHQIPKTKKEIGERVNLTFRVIK
ncbi:alpha-ketoglutarate-dependent dioxygenase AlkB family protein [Haloflavibacter putidus]|uniref:Alpha-ketoglutarate-dependent dioxygenase AlkB n=1 Tax=Haloflavibacter putidus TaxID=2576776 RepID=A0A507ZPQ0_9FLAO|nr:alpha-ketoglutarate-dependent dioxygenase AlkB [Haloflavibacter putidus]TQD38987.1 alpha-ketoglutarate-dependent dioxygenase AlkB [Haloflavibacter putidus]